MGDIEVHNPFPSDQKILEFRKHTPNNELAVKLDTLMTIVFEYFQELKEDPALLDELLLVFQKKVLPIKTTKNIQLLMFFVAETDKNRSNTFISFLLSNIFHKEYQQQQNWFRIVAQSNFYLFSYLRRSKKVSEKSSLKTLILMINGLNEKLA